MKTVINLILLLTTLMNFAQNNNSVEFKLYRNGEFRSLKNVKVKLVKNLDTITCEIVEGKILIPKMIDEFSVVVNIKKKTYVVDKVDFSKLNSDSKFIFGVEKNLENLKTISNQYPNVYVLSNTDNIIKIENLDKAKSVNFVVFTSKSKNTDNSITGKSYTQYSLIK
jgi:hypothetical protein